MSLQPLPIVMALIHNQDSLDVFDSEESESEDSSFSSKTEGVLSDDFDVSDGSSVEEDSLSPELSSRAVDAESDSSMSWHLEEGELVGLADDMATSPTKIAPRRLFSHENESIGAPEDCDDQQTSAPTKKASASINSIIHKDFTANRVIFISLDIETGGPNCGILQLSASVVDQDGTLLGEYDTYVKPPPGAVFLPQAVAVHGIGKGDVRLTGAPSIATAWSDFMEYIEAIMPSDDVGVIVAYNGKSCDMEWIYKTLQLPVTPPLRMPAKVSYFLDPLLLIRSYKSCQLHPSKSKLPDLKLSTVYKFLTNTPLENAHNSKYDCRSPGRCLVPSLRYVILGQAKISDSR